MSIIVVIIAVFDVHPIVVMVKVSIFVVQTLYSRRGGHGGLCELILLPCQENCRT